MKSEAGIPLGFPHSHVCLSVCVPALFDQSKLAHPWPQHLAKKAGRTGRPLLRTKESREEQKKNNAPEGWGCLMPFLRE
jgi:hypothetical protein